MSILLLMLSIFSGLALLCAPLDAHAGRHLTELDQLLFDCFLACQARSSTALPSVCLLPSISFSFHFNSIIFALRCAHRRTIDNQAHLVPIYGSSNTSSSTSSVFLHLRANKLAFNQFISYFSSIFSYFHTFLYF